MSSAKYAFLPWLRTGIATEISQVDGVINSTPVTRPQVNVSMEINTPTLGRVDTKFSLISPGDIKNINLKNIVKVEPVNGYGNFEPNFFPYIEFYDEYFPWRFTPAVPRSTAANRLTPWVFLAVLANPKPGFTGEYQEVESTGDGLPGILVKSSLLPSKTDELWAWSHVQANMDLGNTNNPSAVLTNLKAIQSNKPDIVISRVISSRLLQANTDYTAFLLPVYELGRRSALGIDPPLPAIDVQTLAWNPQLTSEEKIHPVFYRWNFRTGDKGDFESLATKLKANPLNSRVGKRPIDIAPALDVLVRANAITPGQATSINNLSAEGALATRSFTHTDWGDTGKTALRKVINFGEDLKRQATGSYAIKHPYFDDADLKNDPVVLPPFYGRWHSAISRLEGGGWMADLNDDPQYRLAAGIGSQIVRDNQENFMAFAWQQVGDVIEANKKIILAELNKQINSIIFQRHLKSNKDNESFLTMTSTLQSKVNKEQGITVSKHIKDTLLPESTQSQSFRKVIRPRGSVSKAINSNLGLTGLATITQGFQTQLINNLNNPAKTNIKLTQAKVIPNIAIDATLIASAISAVNNAPSSAGIIVPEDKVTNVFTSLQPAANEPPITLPPTTQIGNTVDGLLTGMSPDNTIPKQTTCNIKVNDPELPFPPNVIKPVLSYPKFEFAMFEYLKRISPDFIIPNIHLVPDNTIALLQTNQRFIEAFMVGLNQEFGRELLWREFPTDQRGTYFRNFWSTKDDLLLNNIDDDLVRTEAAADIKPIDKWSNNSSLGSHKTQTDGTAIQDVGTTVDNKVVLIIRGELLRKFPNTTIYAQRAKWKLGPDNLPDKTATKELLDFTEQEITNIQKVRFPKFKAKVEPDVTLIGFDLGMMEARGGVNDPGWFIVMKERSGETRFGLDILNEPSPPPVSKWSDLTYGHFNTSKKHLELSSINANVVVNDPIQWNMDSAQQAHILFQPPVLVALHANKLLTGL